MAPSVCRSQLVASGKTAGEGNVTVAGPLEQPASASMPMARAIATHDADLFIPYRLRLSLRWAREYSLAPRIAASLAPDGIELVPRVDLLPVKG